MMLKIVTLLVALTLASAALAARPDKDHGCPAGYSKDPVTHECVPDVP
jgi:hypothetical protein